MFIELTGYWLGVKAGDAEKQLFRAEAINSLERASYAGDEDVGHTVINGKHEVHETVEQIRVLIEGTSPAALLDLWHRMRALTDKQRAAWDAIGDAGGNITLDQIGRYL